MKLIYLDLSLQGLQILPPIANTLMILDCSQNKLTCLDKSKQDNLVSLDCSTNDLTWLDLPKLVILNCWNNNLTELDLSDQVNLIQLDCSQNKLTGLDFTNLINLTCLICSDNLAELVLPNHIKRI